MCYIYWLVVVVEVKSAVAVLFVAVLSQLVLEFVVVVVVEMCRYIVGVTEVLTCLIFAVV
jgi:hypothetical protein